MSKIGLNCTALIIDVPAFSSSFAGELAMRDLRVAHFLRIRLSWPSKSFLFRDYIASEHLAKKKSPLDIQNWKLVIEKVKKEIY